MTERMEWPYDGLLKPHAPDAESPVASLDDTGKVRFARITYSGKEVKERVPLHVWKLPEEKKADYFRKVIIRLRVEFARKYKMAV